MDIPVPPPPVDPEPSHLDVLPFRPTGHVCITAGEVPQIDQDNLVVDSGVEALMRALLFTTEAISTIVLAYNQGAPVVQSTRLAGSPLLVAAVGTPTSGVTAPVLSTGARGLSTVCKWTAVVTPATSGTYDTAGLLLTSGLLVAATSFPPRTFTSGTPLTIQWTLRVG